MILLTDEIISWHLSDAQPCLKCHMDSIMSRTDEMSSGVMASLPVWVPDVFNNLCRGLLISKIALIPAVPWKA